MNQIGKIQTCLGLNILLLSIVLFFIVNCASPNSKYFRFGPNDDFILVSIHIQTYTKYSILLFLIACINILKVLVQEIGEPVLIFNIYNPDKKVITEFTKTQLQLYGNAMFFVSNVRRVFEIMVTVTQIDIALFSVLIEQLTSIITIKMLLNEKIFNKKHSEEKLNELEIATININDIFYDK